MRARGRLPRTSANDAGVLRTRYSISSPSAPRMQISLSFLCRSMPIWSMAGPPLHCGVDRGSLCGAVYATHGFRVATSQLRPSLTIKPSEGIMARRTVSTTDTSTADTLILSVKPTAVGRTNKSLKFVQNYLVRFGYLEPKFRPGVLDRKTANAIKRYQTRYGIQPTGAFTVATRRSMAQPRCGVPDILHPRARLSLTLWVRTLTETTKLFSVGCAAGTIMKSLSRLTTGRGTWRGRRSFRPYVLRF